MNWRYLRWHLLVAIAIAAFLPLSATSEAPVSFEERRDIYALIHSLGTDNDAVFLRSSRALEEKGEKAVPFLISALTLDPNPRVRYQAARVLSQIRDERGVDALFQAATLDPDDAVRKVAKACLDALIEELNTPQLGDRVRRDYRRFDERSIFSLRRRLRTDRVPSVREKAAQTLGEYGDERDLDSLFEVVRKDRVAAVRRGAAEAIVKIAYPIILSGEYRVTFYGTLAAGPDSFRERIVRALVDLVREEPDASVRLEVVRGLTRLVYPTFLIGEEGFGPLLTLKLRSREVILRVRNCFLSLLRDDWDAEVRKEAAVSLSKLFMALFDRGDEIANEETRRSLLRERRLYYFYPYFPGRIGYVYRRSFTYFPSRAEYLLEPVRDALSEAYSTDPYPGVRQEAVVGLSFLGRKKDSRIILDHLFYERNQDVWLASVHALGQLGGEAAAEALLNVYRMPANGVNLRKAAVLSMARIGNSKVMRNLSGYVFQEPSREVKLAILEALGYQRDDWTAAVLARACRDQNAEVRNAAVAAAGENFTDETVSILKEVLTQDPEEEVRAAACTSLSKALGKEAADFLIAALQDRGPAVRKAASVELGIHGIARSLEVLASALLSDSDAAVRAEAATSLGTIGGQKSVQPLILAVAHDSDPVVREQALRALLKTDQPRAAIIAILAMLPRLAAENPNAYLELDNALPYLRRQTHGRAIANG